MLKTAYNYVFLLILVPAIGCNLFAPPKPASSPKLVSRLPDAKSDSNTPPLLPPHQATDQNTISGTSDFNTILTAKTEPNLPSTDLNELELLSTEPLLHQTEPNVLKTEPNVSKTEPNISKNNKSEPNTPPQPARSAATALFAESAGLLQTFVDDQGFVNYKTLKRKRNDLRNLLGQYAELDPNQYKSWQKNDQIAFWLNTYNLQMLNLIVDNYPIESDAFTRFFYWPPNSILYINRKVGGIEKQKFIALKEQFTFEEVENRFLYRQFNEPRCFLALFHASISSPPLQNEPYYGYKLDKQLDDQIRKYLANPSIFKIDVERQKASLPAVLETSWYGKYFVEKYATDKKFKDQPPETAAVLNFISNYLSQQDRQFIEIKNYSVDFSRYDSRINER